MGSTPDERATPRLTLYFDVNETVIIEDSATRRTREDVLNGMLAHVARGHVIEVAAEGGGTSAVEWRMLPLALECEEIVRRGVGAPGGAAAWFAETRAGERPVCTYTDFLRFHRYPPPHGVHESEEERAARAQKQYRLGSRFTLREEPGEVLRAVYLALEAALGPAPPAAAVVTDDEPRAYFLPSFIAVIRHLELSGREWSLCFRTFGSDLPRVAAHWNHLCHGRYPACADIRMPHRALQVPRACGASVRTGLDARDTHLIWGGGAHLEEQEHARDNLARLAAASAGAHTVLSGLHHAHEALATALATHHTAAVRDQYQFWSAHGRCAGSGKWMVWRPHSAPGELPLFFDDSWAQHAVDVRRELHAGSTEFEAVPTAEVLRTLVWPVDPIDAVLHQDYYIRAVTHCEAWWREARVNVKKA